MNIEHSSLNPMIGWPLASWTINYCTNSMTYIQNAMHLTKTIHNGQYFKPVVVIWISYANYFQIFNAHVFSFTNRLGWNNKNNYRLKMYLSQKFFGVQTFSTQFSNCGLGTWILSWMIHFTLQWPGQYERQTMRRIVIRMKSVIANQNSILMILTDH